MLKKMRWRFVWSAMAAFAAVVIALLCVINIMNYRTTAAAQDDMINRLMEARQHATPDRTPDAAPHEGEKYSPPPIKDTGPFSKEIQYMLRYFSVTYDENGEIKSTDQDFIASVTVEQAESYGKSALQRGNARGYINGYRYAVNRSGEETTVVFLNSERELRAMQSLCLVTVMIAAVCLAVVFLLTVLLSRRAILPYVKNLEAQKMFITNAGHELKTPLTAISASAEVLAAEQPGNEWAESIKKQTGRMSRLIADLVTLSRLDEENPSPEKTEFSLSDSVWEAAEPFSSVARANDRSLRAEVEGGISIIGDETAIKQMTAILLDNAVKYSPPDSCIYLTLRCRGKKAELCVENSCSDIEQIDISRVFDRFYRADKARSGEKGGTGIGLSIARATAEAHGGEISAERHGDNILFRVRLRCS